MARIRLHADAGTKGGGRYLAAPTSVPVFQSGCTVLDLALGGGWAQGRIINLVGDTSTGKTLLAEEACANFAHKFHNHRRHIRYAESESAFDENYARSVGLPVDTMTFPHKEKDKDDESKMIDTVEKFFDDFEEFTEKCGQDDIAGLYVMDSLDALSDQEEKDSAITDGTYGMRKAKLLSRFFRTLNANAGLNNVTLFIVSQVRDKPNVAYGKKETRAGGRALDFYASQIVWLDHLGRLKRTRKGVDRPVGVSISGKVTKTRLGPPFRDVEFPIYFGFGVEDVLASIQWLLKVKRHQEMFASEKEAKGMLLSVEHMDSDEWRDLRKKLRATVKRVWHEIEADFAPRRTKYRQAE